MADPIRAPQFESMATQAHAARLAMWLFLASEVLLFAGLFALYAAYRSQYGLEFRAAAVHNSVWLGTLNTVVLITSSLTVALAVHFTRHGRPRVTSRLLWLSCLLGLLFLGNKAIEYGRHFTHGLGPGSYYQGEGSPGTRLFFTLYYFMTGLHALHVIFGIAVLAWLAERTRRRIFSAAHHVPLELGGLYWHLVDLVWIFLWPLLYLVR